MEDQKKCHQQTKSFEEFIKPEANKKEEQKNHSPKCMEEDSYRGKYIYGNFTQP